MNEMNCEQALVLLPAYADGELDAANTLALERHLAGCPACSAALKTQRALGGAVRNLSYHRAPEALRARLHEMLPQAEPASPVVAAREEPSQRRRRWSRWALPLAASLALAVGLNLALTDRQAQRQLGTELVAGHVRSLQAEHLADVASSDRHTVKPWFAGKLDYAPPVRDLSAQDFPLSGGRLDYIGHRQVAALIYHRRKHVINLYIWPTGEGDAAPRTRSEDGYSLVHWRRDGMDFWAVSDLNAEELNQFATLQIAAGTDKAASGPDR